MPVIQRREWLWAVAWAAIILTITSLPYLYGAAISTPTNQFGGFVIGVEDGNSYLAKMRLGASGAWQWRQRVASNLFPPSQITQWTSAA